MRQRYAAIDIGTNSILLLVAEADRSQVVKPVLQRQAVTRLGQGLHATGTIAPETLAATIDTITEYCRLARAAGAPAVAAVGTHVFRAARNQKEVLAAIRRQTGLTVRVLTEDEEAARSFQAACTGLPAAAVPAEITLIDIGGGSTEVIAGGASGLRAQRSCPVGAVTLTEQFLRHDPVEEAEYQDMLDYIEDMLDYIEDMLPAALLRDRPVAAGLVGVAGTITTLAAIDLKLVRYDATRVHGHLLTRAKVTGMLGLFKERTSRERQHIPGLPAGRADIIVAGTAVLLHVMKAGGFDRILVSDRGLRYGVILEAMGGKR